MTIRSATALAAVLALASAAAPLAAQNPAEIPPIVARDSVTIAAGERYEAGGLKRWLLGRSYRDAWAAPVRVPVVDLARTAGGVEPVRRGGGNQTTSLRFEGADGREYNFRSVDKDLSRGLPDDLQGTWVQSIRQDQTSAQHPGAALVAGGLLDAAGIPHPGPQLAVLPDDPALGEFREEFGGMLGTWELHADEWEDGPPDFLGVPEVESGEDFLEEIEEDPRQRPDARAYLRVRLLDLMLNDWDRHGDQLRWARYDEEDGSRWVPVPEDRDYALADYDGFLVGLARSRLPKAQRFRPDYPSSVYGLISNAQSLDRRLLAELERPAWDSAVASLRATLDDAAIARAVRRLPRAWQALDGERLERTLRARRDRLDEAAAKLYGIVARRAELHATDEAERAELARRPDGSVEVALYAEGDGRPYLRRRFLPRETDEVRLFLHGGDDHAVVRGDGPDRIRLRVVGGGGDDRLENADGSGVAFYDARGDNVFAGRPGTPVDTRPYEPPEWVRGGLQSPPRDWGESASLFAPAVGWRPNVGPVVGGGPARTEYDFRRHPYSAKHALYALWAPRTGGWAAVYDGEVVGVGARRRTLLHLHASEIEAVRFHGFGNDTPGPGDEAEFRVLSRELAAEARADLPLAGGMRLLVGPSFRWTDAEPPAGSPAAAAGIRGADAYSRAGAVAGLRLDRTDRPALPRRGVRLRVDGGVFPLVSTELEPYARAAGDAEAWLPLPLPLEATLKLRAGGTALADGFPFQEAALLGGPDDLRGFATDRFAGDAEAHGGAELRLRIGRANLGLVRADWGPFALADAGRVWYDGDSEDGWHAAAGGGLWASALGRTLTVAYAHGETGTLHLALSAPAAWPVER